MHVALKKAHESLNGLAKALSLLGTDTRPFSKIWGWNCLSLTLQDLVDMATDLVDYIDKFGVKELDEKLAERIDSISSNIEAFTAQTLPQLWGNNNTTAGNLYVSLIESIKSSLAPLSSWEAVQENKMLPAPLSRKLRSLQAEIDEIAPKTQGLQAHIKLIEDATAAAESLPIDMRSLKDAKLKVDKFSTDSAELYGKIDTYLQKSASHIDTMQSQALEASKLVRQCEEAYRVTTSTGLAAAFDERAKSLYRNLGLWVGGLLAALIIGGLIGADRFKTMSAFLTQAGTGKGFHWGLIWMEFVLSVVGLAAPIWFAWLATKQIRQYFVLAEDYSFKASVAKAYEGYRREASRIDSGLEARLFSSALTRLEEAPLRLVENDLHASPWQEFFSSPAFYKALELVPSLKADFVSLAKHGMDKFSVPKLNGKPVIDSEKPE